MHANKTYQNQKFKVRFCKDHVFMIFTELRHHERNKIEKTLFLRHEVGFWFIEAKNVVVGVNNIFLL